MAACNCEQTLVSAPDDAFAKSPASVLITPASALIFAARLLFTGSPLATATICKMFTSAGAAAARIESSVATQAVEQAVENNARHTTTTRQFFMTSFSFFISKRANVCTAVEERPFRAASAPRNRAGL